MLGQEQNLPPLLRSLLSPSVIAGDRGPQVEALQRDLTTAGFAVSATGTYDEATRAVVEAFQKRVGLVPTGVVGSRTRAALARAVAAANAKATQAGTGLALMSPILVVAAGIVALVALGALPKRRRGFGELTVPETHQLAIAKKTLLMPDAMVGVMGGPSKAEARDIISRLKAKSRIYHSTKKDRIVSIREKYFGEVATEAPWRAVGIYPDEGVEVANQRTGETRVLPFRTASSWIRYGQLEPITEEQIEGCDCGPKARKYGLVAAKDGLGIQMAFPAKRWRARFPGPSKAKATGPSPPSISARTADEAKRAFRYKYGHWPEMVWQV